MPARPETAGAREDAPIVVASETTSPADGFVVVAIGASAGGVEAFTQLIRKLPKKAALAIVLVLHLSPTHESHLPELFEMAQTLHVVEARDGMRIEPSRIYVIPPDARLSIDDGRLKVSRRPTDRSQYTPIDYLFQSVAEAYGDRAIGVVLSGSASDGSAGIREIKAAGGITLAQDPAESRFDGMPRAAIETGAVDLVLPVAKLAAELVRLSEISASEPLLVRVSDAGTPPTQLREVYQLLRKRSGVDFSHYKQPTVVRRLQRRMVITRTPTLEAYIKYLQQNRAEVERLYEDILINVTHFFREPEAFDALHERVFPALVESHERDGGPIRIWVPGCSSGEEVYSLAISLLEFVGDKADAIQIQIFGTDVSQKMVERARLGIYPPGISANVSQPRLVRFFTKLDGQYRINKDVRERCVFARQDVTRDPPFSRLDLIVCRNLLIYLGPQLQKRVMSVFHYGLKPRGFLMLGRSESTASQFDLFALADKRHRIYTKKAALQLAELGFDAPSPVRPLRPAPAAQPDAGAGAQPIEGDVYGEANRAILDRYGPAGAIVNRDFRLIRTRGKTSSYLELPVGDARLDLLKMVKQGLLFGVRTALQEAKTRGTAVRREGLRLDGESTKRINVDVTPIGTDSDRHYLILFEEVLDKKAVPKPNLAPAKTKRSKSGGSVAQLEQELVASREYLQSIIQDLEAANEELQSANEEILSSNEELQSTNEELDTAKEELQSTNEELSTVNEELHGRNEELSLVNSDLVNLLGSVNIPIVMVTTDLRIRRFTPAAERLLNLIASDVGRPIGHIKPNIKANDLEGIITRVIESMTVIEQEVDDADGKTHLLRVRPYKNLENRIDGAVLTLIDISTTRMQEVQLRATRAWAEALLSSVSEPIVLLDHELRVENMSRAFSTKFQVEKSRAQGKPLFELSDGAWDNSTLRTLLRDKLPQQKRIEGFQFDLTIPGGPKYPLVLDAWRGEFGVGPVGPLVLLVIHERANGA